MFHYLDRAYTTWAAFIVALSSDSTKESHDNSHDPKEHQYVENGSLYHFQLIIALEYLVFLYLSGKYEDRYCG